MRSSITPRLYVEVETAIHGAREEQIAECAGDNDHYPLKPRTTRNQRQMGSDLVFISNLPHNVMTSASLGLWVGPYTNSTKSQSDSNLHTLTFPLQRIGWLVFKEEAQCAIQHLSLATETFMPKSLQIR